MATHLFRKAKSKAKSLFSVEPQRSTSASSPAPSLTPAQPASQPETQPTSQLTTSLSSTDSKTSPPPPPPSLPERLWNEAYDGLKVSKPKLVAAYEIILSAELHRDESGSIASRPTEIVISRSWETRCSQMQQLVQEGLDRTQKEASFKQGINNSLQAVQAIRGIIDKAVHAAPQAAVAWLGISLGLEILSNPATESQENRKGIAYIVSRMEWYWNLVSLLLDENKAKQSLVGLRVQLEKHIIQLYEKLLSYQMKSVCLYRRNWAAVIGRDMLKLDDWAGQLKEIQDAERAVQKDSDQYNTEGVRSDLGKLVDIAQSREKALYDIRSAIQGVRSVVQDVHSAILDQAQQQRQKHHDGKDEQCRQDLRETDPRDDKTRIEGTKGTLLRDCYSWILGNDDFRRWRDSPQSQLLWIKGDPGKGKTMLLCGIIDELEKDPSNRLSYFFCQATEARLSNATAVLRGLIYLLVDRQPSLISHVRERYDHAGRQLFEDWNAWEAMSKILGAMLNEPNLNNTILIVDALDECKTDRHKLLDFIAKPSRVKWIVSSRNWPDIEEKLNNTKQKVGLELELNKDSISKAVDKYIEKKVDQLADLKGYDPETTSNVQRHLVDNADGTFLWVALVCQELADPKVRKWHTLTRLQSFPPGLDSLYGRMIQHICQSEDADLCKEVLAIASAVYRPITLDELKVLAESLKDIDPADLEDIIGSCGSFLTVREGAIYFVHQSAKEYLLSKAFGQILPHGIAHQHRVILLASVEALSLTLCRDIYGLASPGSSVDEVSPPNPDPLAHVRYSCEHWVSHLEDADPAEEVTLGHLQDGGLAHTFLQRKYLYWLEAMSLQRSMPQAVLAVQKLQALVAAARAPRLADLVEDARRFVLSYKGAIEIAPLQLYASALIFSPAQSLVRNLFKDDAPDWITSPSQLQLDWNACMQTLEGHGGPVCSVAFTADGRRLASGSSDNTIKIWNADTGQCVQTLKGHSSSGNVNSVAFSTDGIRVASGSDDNTIKIWHAATGTCIQTLKGHNDSVSSVAFTADSRQLASGSRDKTVKVWNVATGTCTRTLNGHDDLIRSVVFTADGRQLASGSEDHIFKVWNVATGTCIQTLKGHGDWACPIAFTADGTRVASVSGDVSTVEVWDVTKGQCVQTLDDHDGLLSSIAFTADGRRLALGSEENTLQVWDVATGQCLQILQGHGGGVWSVAFSMDGTRLASGSVDSTVKVWKLWDTAMGPCVQTVQDHGGIVKSVAFTMDGTWLASGSEDGTVKVWDVATGQCMQILEGHYRWVWSVAFAANGTQLASGSADFTVRVWDVATGRCLQTLRSPDGAVRSVAFATDGIWLASGSEGRTVKVWNAATGQCLQTLEGHMGSVVSIAFTADRTRLASGSSDGTVKIWNAAIGVCLQTLKGHGNWVTSMAFTADGIWVASGSSDQTIKIWHAATGTCIQTLAAGAGICCLSFDSRTNSSLLTELGTLPLEPLALGAKPQKASPTPPHYYGFGISCDGTWIVKDTRRLLWLPSEYRPRQTAVAGSFLALGCSSGRVAIFQLVPQGLKL